MVYIICYDLNKEQNSKDYKELYETIKSYGTYAHYLDSTWFIETEETSKQIYDRLSPCIDDNDHIFITRIYGNYYARLNTKAFDWINARNY